jgi:hypothetical protein
MKFTLYGEVKSEMLYIQKRVLSGEDEYANVEWTNIRDQIIALAKTLKQMEKELKERDREERKERRAAILMEQEEST